MNIAVDYGQQVHFWLKAKIYLVWHEFYRCLAHHWYFNIYYIEVIKIVQVPHTKRISSSMTISCYKEFIAMPSKSEHWHLKSKAEVLSFGF